MKSFFLFIIHSLIVVYRRTKGTGLHVDRFYATEISVVSIDIKFDLIFSRFAKKWDQSH